MFHCPRWLCVECEMNFLSVYNDTGGDHHPFVTQHTWVSIWTGAYYSQDTLLELHPKLTPEDKKHWISPMILDNIPTELRRPVGRNRGGEVGFETACGKGTPDCLYHLSSLVTHTHWTTRWMRSEPVQSTVLNSVKNPSYVELRVGLNWTWPTPSLR